MALTMVSSDIAQNKLKAISGIKHLKLLRKIDLGANRIRLMPSEELSGLQNLEELWLGKNKIEKIDGLENLTKLRRLDVQSNRLTTVDNLEAQVDTLEELYLAHNGITVEGATVESGLALKFTQLSTLDLSKNRLANASPFSHLTSLTDLWISGNDIKTFDDVQPLGSLTNLDGIYLEHNPVASDFEYRMQVAKIMPSLTQIDANMIGCAPTFDRGAAMMDKLREMQERALEKAAAAADVDETAAAVRDGEDQGPAAGNENAQKVGQGSQDQSAEADNEAEGPEVENDDAAGAAMSIDDANEEAQT